VRTKRSALPKRSQQFDVHFKSQHKRFAFSETAIYRKPTMIGLLQADTRPSFAAGY
jgi:hypothetical protein